MKLPPLPLLAFPLGVTAQLPPCPALHLILARASTEPHGPGFMGAVAHLIVQSVPNTTLSSVDYPATFSEYPRSQTLGVHELRRMIISHSARCPDTKLALLGFSQGGHVIMDVLCGRPENREGGWEGVEALGGMDIASCEPYTPVIREWCDAGDEFCDRGNSTKVHAGYFVRYMGAAAEFVVERYNASLPKRGEPTVSPPSPTVVSEGSMSGAEGLAVPGVRCKANPEPIAHPVFPLPRWILVRMLETLTRNSNTLRRPWYPNTKRMSIQPTRKRDA
ncbi:cutinase-domain-containing protein [Schizothecium vesticola]|uniref:Cutinase-domain-containing protein n=1 Tax=Schizothecium vesticola TaxID=314040 RepID=A0AA40EXF3_9PEZI|nr:cutinase-domain-containing protein [Schizothecium vesticola]